MVKGKRPKQKYHEHKFVAHCLAHLIEKRPKTKVISYSVNRKSDFLKILKKDLKNKLPKERNPEIGSIINQVESADKTSKGPDLKVRCWNTITEVIEVKGEDRRKESQYVYAFYTILGQHICSFKKFVRHEWYGIACPASWKPSLYNKLKNNPIINLISKECKKKRQKLHFYFISKDGSVEPCTWSSFCKGSLKAS
jgi:hypothetical protein